MPNREGFSPDVVLKSIFHGPDFWLEAFDVPAADPLPALVERGLGLLRWQAQVAGQILDDPASFAGWAREIEAKQRRLIETLATTPARPSVLELS